MGLRRCKWCECQIHFHAIDWHWVHSGTLKSLCWTARELKRATPEDDDD